MSNNIRLPNPYHKVKCPKCKGRFWDILETTIGNSKIECHECHYIYMTSKSEEQIQKDIELRKQAEIDYKLAHSELYKIQEEQKEFAEQEKIDTNLIKDDTND